MAVLLCRSDGKPYPAPPPLELRGLPRIVVDYEPLPDHLSYLGKPVKARTETHFACSDQSRDEKWKESHDRHRTQLTHCGFHTPNFKAYKDMGAVELDDAKLILDGLGQTMENKAIPHKHPKLVKLDVEHRPRPACMVSPYQVKLHSKTPSQFPTDLLTLDQRLSNGNSQLGHMRRGRRLFSLMQKEKQKKLDQEEEKLQSDQASLMSQWREAEVASEDELENGLPLSTRPDSGSHDHTEERQRKMSTVLDADYQSLRVERPSKVDLSTDEGGVARGDGELAYQWYRKLCVIVWILEAMQLDSAHYAVPLAKCWNLDGKYTDEIGRKRVHERNQKIFREWQALKLKVINEKNIATPSKSFRNKVAALIAFRSSPSMVAKKTTSMASTAKDDETVTSSSVKSRSMTRMEEERMKKQKKLTPGQMDNLMTMIDEELNYTQKQSRTRINALREAGQAKQQLQKQRILKKWNSQTPPVTLDLHKVQTRFLDADEERRMIVHEQLTAMERDREEAIQQRLGSLHVSGNLWSDLATMRKGVEIESSEMARRKLLMNYEWFEELVSSLPERVLCDRYCSQLLENLSTTAKYMYGVGPRKMSRNHLIQVLATLTPWELHAPDIAAAIKYIIKHVVYIAEEDYSKWLEQHIAVYHYSHPRKESEVKASTSKANPSQSALRTGMKDSSLHSNRVYL